MDKLEYRVCQLEERVDKIYDKLDLVLENHLPHINSRVAVLIAQMVIVMAALAYMIFK